MKRRQTIKNNQQGLVSIVVTLVFMSLITLIVISFAYLMRNEQQQALDRQLSTQAFYAAESGVNDAVAALKNGSISGDITECQEADLNYDLDAEANVGYTCVLINQSPDYLEYGSIETGHSTVVALNTNGSNIDRVEISWQDSGGSEVFASDDGGYSLPTREANEDDEDSFANHTGILRTTVIPANDVSRGALRQNSKTYFMYPSAGSETGNINYTETALAQDNNVAFGDGNCNTEHAPKFCNVAINNLGSLNTDNIFLRLKAIYQPVSVTVRVFSAEVEGERNQLELFGAQAIVDSTGKAMDVLRRIQVHVPLRDDYYYPEFAIESMDSICKRLAVSPSGAQVDLPSGVNPADHPACQI